MEQVPYEAFVLSRAGFSKGSHGFDVREERDTTDPKFPLPDALFFTYLTFDEDSKLVVQHYLDPGIQDVGMAEAALLALARTGQTGGLANFQGLVWDAPCYFTMVIDKPGWDFYWRDAPGHDPLIFLSEKEVILPNGQVQKQFYDPNYSFLNAQIVSLPGCSAMRCINFHKQDIEGNPIGPGQTRNYCFEIYLEAPFSVPGLGVDRITILIDPDGQNQGPPNNP